MRNVLFCALLLVSAACAARAEEEDTAVTARPLPAGWVSFAAAPVRLDALSRTGGTLRIELAGSDRRQLHSVELAPDTPARIDITQFSSGSTRAEWSLGAESGAAYIGGRSYDNGGGTPILAVNAILLRELELANQSAGGDRTLSSMPAEDLPSDWRAYAGLNAQIVMSREDAARLTPAQTRALDRWVGWFGGIRIIVDENSDAQAIHENNDAPPFLFGPAEVTGYDLLEGLGEIPVSFIVLSLVFLGVLLGPVAYLVVRRRRNPLLFFVIVPAIALLGTAGIIGGAFLLEGADVQYNQFAVLARRADDTDAMFYDFRGVRPGILLPEVKFGNDTLALPFAGNDNETVFDADDGVAFVAGWLRPRFATGYLTVRPVVSRLNIDIEPDGTGFKAVNNLGFAVKRVAARLPGGTIGYAENVPAGESASLAPERSPRRYDELVQNLYRLNANKTPLVANPVLIAKTEGLPYADDGGLGGTPRATSFFYAVAERGAQ